MVRSPQPIQDLFSHNAYVPSRVLLRPRPCSHRGLGRDLALEPLGERAHLSQFVRDLLDVPVGVVQPRPRAVRMAAQVERGAALQRANLGSEFSHRGHRLLESVRRSIRVNRVRRRRLDDFRSPAQRDRGVYAEADDTRAASRMDGDRHERRRNPDWQLRFEMRLSLVSQPFRLRLLDDARARLRPASRPEHRNVRRDEGLT
jgi:hypothetical protein